MVEPVANKTKNKNKNNTELTVLCPRVVYLNKKNKPLNDMCLTKLCRHLHSYEKKKYTKRKKNKFVMKLTKKK